MSVTLVCGLISVTCEKSPTITGTLWRTADLDRLILKLSKINDTFILVKKLRLKIQISNKFRLRAQADLKPGIKDCGQKAALPCYSNY